MENTIRTPDLDRIERLQQTTARYVAELDWALRSARRLEAAGLQAAGDLRAHLELAVAHGEGTPASVLLAAVRVARSARFRQQAGE